MKKLTAEELRNNFERLIEFISTEFSGNRKEKLLDLYNGLGERIMMAPASGNEGFHNCFIGGYCDHVLNVIDCARAQYEMWSAMNANTDSYTYEELMFSALNHDLGKVGDLDNEYYIPNPSEWHRKNQGKIYEHNKNLTYMRVADRSLFLLQQADISITTNEFLAIKLHDGLYVDDNKAYYFSGYNSGGLKNHLPILLHHADHMASTIERESQLAQEQPLKDIKASSNGVTNKNRMKSFTKIAETNTTTQKHSDLFNELFKDV